MDNKATLLLEHVHIAIILVDVVVVCLYVANRTWSHLRRHYPEVGERRHSTPAEILLIALSLLVIVFASRVEQLGDDFKHDLEEIKHTTAMSDLQRFKALRGNIDANLNKVYGDRIQSQLNDVTDALGGHYSLRSIDDVRMTYRNMLPKFGKAEFWATSIPSKDFLWGYSDVLKAIDDFINKQHGKMTRIFFINGATPTREENEIMAGQARVHVDVYYISLDDVPEDLRQPYFLVDSKAHIGWQGVTDQKGHLMQVLGTVNPKETEKYCENFKRLSALDAKHRFTP
jgi:hypothetical protein